MEADKGHLHHRIMAVGLGQRRTVLMLYSISGIMGVAAVLMSIDVPELPYITHTGLWIEAIALVVIAGTLIFVFLDNHKILARQQEAIDKAICELERKVETKRLQEGGATGAQGAQIGAKTDMQADPKVGVQTATQVDPQVGMQTAAQPDAGVGEKTVTQTDI